MKLTIPCAYQGGKQRIAADIIDIINPDPNNRFYDLCCGSGAISIELVNRGFPASSITMVDKSPFGLVWETVGNGSFDLSKFKYYCQQIPKDLDLIQGFIKDLSKSPPNDDRVYVYLLLQAASFGSKSIWIDKGRWQNCSFRSFWKPTATSSRRSVVNPLMPMPNTLILRMETICEKMSGIKGYCQDIYDTQITEGSIIYIDPPYVGTTAYGFNFNVTDFVTRVNKPVYVSEGKALSSIAYQVSSHRSKGGISGDRKVEHQEWLSLITP